VRKSHNGPISHLLHNQPMRTPSSRTFRVHGLDLACRPITESLVLATLTRSRVTPTFLRPSPSAVLANSKISVFRMGSHDQVENHLHHRTTLCLFAYCSFVACTFPLMSSNHPIQVVQQDPATWPQEVVHQVERVSCDGPVVSAV
jgi:hypothetical protein